ncbi:hypothetical protein [Streptomyces chartreusis]|nr:hypothetical protein [Streptomyces chartreusis]WUB18301.1 hypothetical protein OG997_16935 [Streptomyces chartreusis]
MRTLSWTTLAIVATLSLILGPNDATQTDPHSAVANGGTQSEIEWP